MGKFRRRPMNNTRLFLFIILISTLYACSNKDNSNRDKNTVNPDSVEVVSGYGEIGSLNEITEITTEISGIVGNIFHEAGDSLQKGDTLIYLNHEDEIIRKKRLETELERVNTALLLLEQQIETAEKTLQTKKLYLERLENSLKAGAESKQNVDDAKLKYEQAKSNLEELHLKKKSRLNEYETQEQVLNQHLLTLNKHFIKSPGKGLLLSLNINKNEAVKALQSVGQFIFKGPYAIRAEIDELYAGEIKMNMKALAVPYGRNDTIAYGHITFISPKLKERSMFSEENTGFMDRRVREIEIRIDSTSEEILIGERVNLIIEIR
ncbi:MAG: HlyD family secretion protein [Bacteroidota bacterium]